MCEVNTKRGQYLIECQRHGNHYQSYYHDCKTNRLNQCKYCHYEETYTQDILKINKEFTGFINAVYNTKQLVKINCQKHGLYEKNLNSILRSVYKTGCESCQEELRILNNNQIFKKTKVCSKCGIEKSINEFNTFKRKGNLTKSLESNCKECSKEIKREYSRKVYGSKLYFKRINKYRNSDKYIQNQKELLEKRKRILFTNIYYHNCICCDFLYISKKENPKYKLCNKCNNEFNQIKYYKKYKAKPKECKCTDCGIIFIGTKTKSRCSKCQLIKKRIWRKSKNTYRRTHIKRAKHYGCYIEDVKPIKVFKRDKFKCQVCGIKCDINKHYNSNNYPTLGHIVPLSLKGSHTYSNCQCECRKCNSIKSNKILGQQMTIFCLDPGQG